MPSWPRDIEELDLKVWKLERFLGHKVFGGFVRYKVKIKDVKRAIYLTEGHFKEEDDYERLIRYKNGVTGKKFNGGEVKCEIARIVAHRVLPNVKQRVYLVEWEGWKHPLWRTELKANEFTDAQDLLDKYRKKHNIRSRG